MQKKAKIAAVILAAGESKRFQGIKQLAMINGQTFIELIIKKAKQCGLEPIIVVLGANRDLIHEVITNYNVSMIENPDWKNGISTSVNYGLGSLPASVEGAMMLMVDQPNLPLDLLKLLVSEFDKEHDFFVPEADGQYRNPVIISRVAFERVNQLQGDTGAKVLFSAAKVKSIHWANADSFTDVDTTNDYKDIEINNNCA